MLRGILGGNLVFGLLFNRVTSPLWSVKVPSVMTCGSSHAMQRCPVSVLSSFVILLESLFFNDFFT